MNSRREFLRRTMVAGAATVVSPAIADGVYLQNKKTRVLRIAHITDVHMLDQPNAEKLFASVLREINIMQDKPNFIINTGDTVFDENGQLREAVEARWKSWNKVVAQENKLEMFSALGNHDVWFGPDEKTDAEYKRDKRYGKTWALQELKMQHRYYSFERNGWVFIALDSINGPDGYQLDEEQFTWLKSELAKAGKKPVCVFNHVPILSIGALLYYTKRKPLKEVHFPSGDMHNDHQRLKDLFLQTKNVKLCLSGHVHYIDATDYVGVKYLCNGAVSGNWWGNPLALDEFPPVYAIVDLYSDGSVEHEYVFYTEKT